MRYHADLHIHSKYSRATSKHCDLEHLAYWARRKGIAVVGTGDFTHPAWRAELKEKLVPAEPGLFRLRPDLEDGVAARLPAACGGATRFLLSVEISTIYKKGESTRKIHHLIYVPDFAAADRVADSLARIGNIASDGRPILGLDSRHLLEIALESGPGSYLVPAHIWTPWFAVLGSRSGFDSVTECYGDLADHIFAVETGLSSDPAMNWRISFLDRYRLVSNSDAHSPGKLGREATLFDTELDYFGLRRALETGEGYRGTVEFFPEEGKYHLDGHRKCDVRLTPEETKANGGRCPVCGQPVTVGVMHRVDALADRAEAEAAPPDTAGEVLSLVPLPEMLSEIVGSGPTSQKVERRYGHLLSSLGSELSILEEVPTEDIARAESSLLAEAVTRLRAGQVIREAGYDGEYGTIKLFSAAELREARGGGMLFDLAVADVSCQKSDARKVAAVEPPAAGPTDGVAAQEDRFQEAAPETPPDLSPILAALDADQRSAAEAVEGPLLIVAGPGSGKTRTLTHRIAHLVADCGAAPERCLAITFTRRAAAEMKQRLAALLPKQGARVPVHTFHSLGLSILREHGQAVGLHRGFRIAEDGERAAALAESLGISEAKAGKQLNRISLAKRSQAPDDAETGATLAAYSRAMALRNWIDLDDLVGLALKALSEDPGLAALYRERYAWISVDEFQDLDAQQYALVRCLAPPEAHLCAIGDPNQAIYGFRGADAAGFQRFAEDYPTVQTVRLTRNYRSSSAIVTASSQVIARAGETDDIAQVVRALSERITLHVARSDKAEAEFVVHRIEDLIGGHSLFSIDSGRTAGAADANLSFADFAVLYRSDAQAAALVEALARSGIPFQKHAHGRLAEDPAIQSLMTALESQNGAADQALAARLDSAAASLNDQDPETIETALLRLRGLALDCDDDPARLREAVQLASEADLWDPRADRVALLTLHAAKGLEFPVVFITGLEDGILPLRWGGADDPAALAEERRLFYVGMTRAQDRLYLCRAEQRPWRGKLREPPPSPYLADIEAALLEHSHSEATRRKEPDRQLALF